MGCLSSDSPQPEEATATEMQQLQQARDTWRRYKQTYIPLEETQMQRISEMRSAGERSQAVADSVSEARQGIGRVDALAQGENAGSASHINRALALESASAEVAANAAMQAEQVQEERYQRGKQRIIDFGLGKASTAALMTSRSANQAAAQEAINTGSRNTMSNFNSGANMAAAGMMASGAAAGLGAWAGRTPGVQGNKSFDSSYKNTQIQSNGGRV